jgi:hypothetical protein
MKTYKLFENGSQKVAVKQGWSWPAFFLTWIWAFTKSLVVPGIVGLLFTWPPALIITGIVFGLKGNNWWEGQLIKSGYSAVGTVQARNPAEAVSSKP